MTENWAVIYVIYQFNKMAITNTIIGFTTEELASKAANKIENAFNCLAVVVQIS
jgi:hypothetical protein